MWNLCSSRSGFSGKNFQKNQAANYGKVRISVLWFAFVAPLLLTGCSSTNNLTLQGQISDLQNQRVAIQNERDSWKTRYEELENSNRAQVHAIASSQQQIQTLKAEQLVLQRQLKESLDQVATAQQQNEFLSKQLSQYEDIRRQQEDGSGFSSNRSEQELAEKSLPSIQNTVVTQLSDGRVCLELPGEILFEETGVLSPKGQDLIRQAGRAIVTTYPGAKVEIQGHLSPLQKVSSHFKDAKDQSMSQAMTVHNVLVTENILPENSLNVSACGTSHPHVSSATTQGNYRNYRVELIVTPQ